MGFRRRDEADVVGCGPAVLRDPVLWAKRGKVPQSLGCRKWQVRPNGGYTCSINAAKRTMQCSPSSLGLSSLAQGVAKARRKRAFCQVSVVFPSQSPCLGWGATRGDICLLSRVNNHAGPKRGGFACVEVSLDHRPKSHTPLERIRSSVSGSLKLVLALSSAGYNSSVSRPRSSFREKYQLSSVLTLPSLAVDLPGCEARSRRSPTFSTPWGSISYCVKASKPPSREHPMCQWPNLTNVAMQQEQNHV